MFFAPDPVQEADPLQLERSVVRLRRHQGGDHGVRLIDASGRLKHADAHELELITVLAADEQGVDVSQRPIILLERQIRLGALAQRECVAGRLAQGPRQLDDGVIITTVAQGDQGGAVHGDAFGGVQVDGLLQIGLRACAVASVEAIDAAIGPGAAVPGLKGDGLGRRLNRLGVLASLGHGPGAIKPLRRRGRGVGGQGLPVRFAETIGTRREDARRIMGLRLARGQGLLGLGGGDVGGLALAAELHGHQVARQINGATQLMAQFHPVDLAAGRAEAGAALGQAQGELLADMDGVADGEGRRLERALGARSQRIAHVCGAGRNQSRIVPCQRRRALHGQANHIGLRIIGRSDVADRQVGDPVP
ncbi:hypothetical protein D3C85_1060280 [compost metagenome]